MSLAPLNLISAHPWQRMTFTTYALILSFFEAVILDALMRGGGREALILADVEGVRASLSEQGAQRVSKDYKVEPFPSHRAYFIRRFPSCQPKTNVILLAGSGNLTFGGWGGNYEALEDRPIVCSPKLLILLAPEGLEFRTEAECEFRVRTLQAARFPKEADCHS